MNPEYDENVSTLNELLADAETTIKSVRTQFRDSSIKWVHKGKEKYQIEIPISTTAKHKLPADFEQASATKKAARYWSKTTRRMAADIAAAELRKEEGEKDAARVVFEAFAKHYPLWIAAVEVASELDSLLSLAQVSKHHIGCVRPEFVSFEANGNRAMLELRQSVHPTLYESANVNGLKPDANQAFIANDVFLGVPDENPSRFVLVSGPNMGGKSTLLRQTCSSVILAQIGCWIPAEACRLTPVDRIFTRVGANDAIMQGKSTFLMEMLETSVILKNATSKSLVILDELGQSREEQRTPPRKQCNECAELTDSFVCLLFFARVSRSRYVDVRRHGHRLCRYQVSVRACGLFGVVRHALSHAVRRVQHQRTNRHVSHGQTPTHKGRASERKPHAVCVDPTSHA